MFYFKNWIDNEMKMVKRNMQFVGPQKTLLSICIIYLNAQHAISKDRISKRLLNFTDETSCTDHYVHY